MLLGGTWFCQCSGREATSGSVVCSLAVPPRMPAADEALEDELAQVVHRAIRGDAAGNAGHLLHEVHKAQVEVVLDQGEARDPDAGGGAMPDLVQGVGR